MNPFVLTAHVRAVLDDLCRAAGVSPAETSAEAGQAVLSVIWAHPLMRPATDVLHCPLNELVRALVFPDAQPHEVMVAVTSERVILTRHLTEPLGTRANRGAGHARAFVELPPALKAAVAQYDRFGLHTLKRAA